MWSRARSRCSAPPPRASARRRSRPSLWTATPTRTQGTAMPHTRSVALPPKPLRSPDCQILSMSPIFPPGCRTLRSAEGTDGKVCDLRKSGGNGIGEHGYLVAFFSRFSPIIPPFLCHCSATCGGSSYNFSNDLMMNPDFPPISPIPPHLPPIVPPHCPPHLPPIVPPHCPPHLPPIVPPHCPPHSPPPFRPPFPPPIPPHFVVSFPTFPRRLRGFGDFGLEYLRSLGPLVTREGGGGGTGEIWNGKSCAGWCHGIFRSAGPFSMSFPALVACTFLRCPRHLPFALQRRLQEITASR